MVEAVIDTIATIIQAIIDTIATIVQAIIDTITARVEAILDSIATIVDAIGNPVGDFICEGRAAKEKKANCKNACFPGIHTESPLCPYKCCFQYL